MSSLIVVGIVAVLLFLVVFITKRRFGVLGLALAAGSILSSLWAEELTPVVQQAGIELNQPPLMSVVAMVLVLLPALILVLGHGPKNSQMTPRIIGAAAFTILGLAFLVEPLGIALIIDGVGQSVYGWLVQYKVLIITIGLVFAVYDVATTKPAKLEDKKGKH